VAGTTTRRGHPAKAWATRHPAKVRATRRELEDNTAAVATIMVHETLRIIAAACGHAEDVPGGIKEEVTLAYTPVSA